MLSKNIETFLGCDADFAKARIVVFGAPFDSTTSYRPGTRFASRVMRAESYGLETYSPYQDLDLQAAAVFDAGDLELPFGNSEMALAAVSKFTDSVLAAGKKPLMIGGEHLLTLGAVRPLASLHNDLAIIHFDAHTDLRQEYLGVSLSHASVLRRVWELTGDGSVFQFGIRSGEREEFLWAQQHTYLHKFNFAGLRQALQTIGTRPVYLTLDLDVLDPSIFPGTGTPEAGGVNFQDLLAAVRLVMAQVRVIGCDLVELSPHYDQSGASTAVAVKMWRELVLAWEKPFIV